MEIFGYTRNQIKELFDDKFMNMVHPDDRDRVMRGADILTGSEGTYNMEYRMKAARRYIWVIDQTRHMLYGDKEFFQGVVLEVTELVTLRERLRLLLAHVPEDFVLVSCHDGRFEHEIIADGLARTMGYSREGYLELLEAGGYLRNGRGMVMGNCSVKSGKCQGKAAVLCTYPHLCAGTAGACG